MSKLRIGQVGVGGFGAERRRRMRATGLFDLVAVHDWNDKAAVSAAEQDGAQVVDSYEALLDHGALEAVVISTGAKYHADQVVAAAERGLHVFVEKPLCSTSDEVQRILDVQQRTGVVIGMGHHDHAHDPTSQTIADIIRSGEMGTVVAFDVITAHSGGFVMGEDEWRSDPAKNPGGMLFQCGVHKIHELLYYLGPVAQVYAQMRYDVHTTATADSAVCTLSFASGPVGTLSAYHVTPYRHHIALYGTKQNLYVNLRYFDEGTTITRQRLTLDGSKQPLEPIDIEGRSVVGSEMISFYRAVTTGQPCYPSAIDGARALAVIFAADESAKANQPVQVQDVQVPAGA